MATSAFVEEGNANALGYRILDVTLSNSYTTGGEVIPGLPSVLKMFFIEQPSGTGNVFDIDRSTRKLKAYRTGAAANAVLNEVVAATDLSAITVRILVFFAK